MKRKRAQGDVGYPPKFAREEGPWKGPGYGRAYPDGKTVAARSKFAEEGPRPARNPGNAGAKAKKETGRYDNLSSGLDGQGGHEPEQKRLA